MKERIIQRRSEEKHFFVYVCCSCFKACRSAMTQQWLQHRLTVEAAVTTASLFRTSSEDCATNEPHCCGSNELMTKLTKTRNRDCHKQLHRSVKEIHWFSRRQVINDVWHRQILYRTFTLQHQAQHVLRRTLLHSTVVVHALVTVWFTFVTRG